MSPGFKKTNLVSMRKTITENDKNGSEEVSGERVWSNYGYFHARKLNYLLEKINFPENTLLYINQLYLTVNKCKKIFYCDFFMIAKIVAPLNPPQDIFSHALKENEVKMVMPLYDPKTWVKWVI